MFYAVTASTTPIIDTSSFIQTAADEGVGNFSEQIGAMFGVLGILLIAVFTIVWMMKYLSNKRLYRQASNSAIKVIERRSMGPKTTIYILEVLDKVLCVAENPTGWSVLAEFPKGSIPPAVAEDYRSPSLFDGIIKKFTLKQETL